MNANAFAPTMLFAVVATLSPGGATTLATASGAQFGLRRSVPLIAGIALGVASLAALAAIGLGGLLLEVRSFQLILRLSGSVYLAGLAYKIARSGPPTSPNLRAAARPTSLIAGAALLWSNPKAWVMALSATASFAALASGPLQLAVLLGTTFGLAATVSLTTWCAAGHALALVLRTNRAWRALNISLGSLLLASILPMWTN